MKVMTFVLVWILAFLPSLVFTGWLAHARAQHRQNWSDDELLGPQKFHEHPVPRVGGIGVALGLWLAAAFLWWLNREALGAPALSLLLCGLPVLGAGLAEDVTKRVSPVARLLFTALSAALGIAVLGVFITRTDLPGLDWAVSFTPVAMLLTVFAVVGVANSINLIDGFNGLASACVAIMLLGLALVAWRVGDALVISLAVAGMGAVLGFLIWNFPRGLVFLGDGGAYFLGFFLAQVALLLLFRNPQVSPLFPLLLVIYPVFETVFSMYRRKVLKGRPVGQPDAAHLHSLIYRRFLRSNFGEQGRAQRIRRNSMTSPFLWLLTLFSVIPAVVFWNNSMALMLCGLIFAVIYVTLYWRIVRFRVLRWRLASKVHTH